MAYNERTSETVATKAARLLKMDCPYGVDKSIWEDVKAVSASALTQAPDKAVPNVFKSLTFDIKDRYPFDSHLDILGASAMVGINKKE